MRAGLLLRQGPKAVDVKCATRRLGGFKGRSYRRAGAEPDSLQGAQTNCEAGAALLPALARRPPPGRRWGSAASRADTATATAGTQGEGTQSATRPAPPRSHDNAPATQASQPASTTVSQQPPTAGAGWVVGAAPGWWLGGWWLAAVALS